MVGWMLRGNAMCALLVAGRSWASGMPEGHWCNAGLQSSVPAVLKTRSRSRPHQLLAKRHHAKFGGLGRTWGRRTSTLRASHLFSLTRTSRNKNPQLLWVRGGG